MNYSLIAGLVVAAYHLYIAWRRPEYEDGYNNSRGGQGGGQGGGGQGGGQGHNNQGQVPGRSITYRRNGMLCLPSIYKGNFDQNTEVAVKIVRIRQSDRAWIDTYLASLKERLIRVVDNNHDAIKEGSIANIVWFYCYEFEIGENTLHLLLALELCDCNLEEYIQSRHNHPPISNNEIISQILFGLQYLHSRQIVHGNLKPSNILLQKGAGGGQVFKLSDFGLYKMNTRKQEVTLGWIPPEMYALLISQDFYPKESFDIFPLGLIFHFIVTNGHYVFKTQEDIQSGNADFTHVVSNRPLFNLLRLMLAQRQDDRPLTQAIMKHPALWSCEKMLDFFCNASNLLTDRSKSRNCTIEDNSANVLCGGNWRVHLTSSIENYLFSTAAIHNRNSSNQNQPDCDETSVKSLLRAIRNNDIKGHYNQLQPGVRTEFGNYPDGYLRYWTNKFPDLLMHVYDEMKVYGSEPSMKTFYA
ncbi:serine/threonine-protein kinase/endoribonuclease IRE1-like [Ruditapes philippinarum]|uniref:serine/threonine-protein kinase/endoribonuclease IRE1-like n=1 Tax=Ruditapes philippinarum TaxID=129788 RepID=UPI00295A6E27|nr:serine/threonine-protein kinase/endoribonuclease IRE1-like [Ruditapes philippinarum]XP_060598520.1 serine/threonine-protein kinase/endoribonuclease IRE1-like [Ruditapes philippinarum]